MKNEEIQKDIKEGLNIPKKKYPDKITGDYPDGFGVKTEYWPNGNIKSIHITHSNGSWAKWDYDEAGNLIYDENSNGYWIKREYDEDGNKTYYENSNGYWTKREYDKDGNAINL